MSSKRFVVVDGKDPRTKPILEYLERVYGMPAKDIRGVTLESEVGQVQMITVTVMVRDENGRVTTADHFPTPEPFAEGGPVTASAPAVVGEMPRDFP